MEKQNELLINESKSNNLAVKSNKQIDEMATIICQNTEFDTMWGECYQSAKALYNAGYRKASDVAREIFEEIESSLSIGNFKGSEVYYAIRAEDYLHYKKKYTEGV